MAKGTALLPPLPSSQLKILNDNFPEEIKAANDGKLLEITNPKDR